jgi:hypothetical protein
MHPRRSMRHTHVPSPFPSMTEGGQNPPCECLESEISNGPGREWKGREVGGSGRAVCKAGGKIICFWLRSIKALFLFAAGPELATCLETSYTSADNINVCRDGALSLDMELNRTPKLVKSLIVNCVSGKRDGSSGDKTTTVLGSNICIWIL